VEGALSELFTSVSDGKTLIAAAITDKGVSTSASDTFGTMATNIGSISSGGASIVPVLDLDGIDNTGSGHNASATTWKDLSATVADAVKAAGNTVWGDKYLRLDGASYWNVNAPNLSRGTMEVVVSIDADFVSVNTTEWYNASCLFGIELGGSQQDFGILIDRNGMFAIGYANSTIYSSTINAKDGLPHTISYTYYRGPVQFAIDGVVIATLTTGCGGSEVSSIGIGWNKNGSGSKVKGNIYSVKWFKELLTSVQVLSNHNANKTYYGF